MKAKFYIKRLGLHVKDNGEVELRPYGLYVKPPAGTTKKAAASALGFAFLGPIGGAVGSQLVKGKPFTIPYDRIKSASIREIKGLIGGPKPFIELVYVNDVGATQTLTFAPFEGTIRTNFKTYEFYGELERRLGKRKAKRTRAPKRVRPVTRRIEEEEVVEEEEEVEVVRAAPPRKATKPALRCPNCGARVEPEDKFCANCGTRLPKATPAFCPNCGVKVPPGARFCPSCGTKLV